MKRELKKDSRCVLQNRQKSAFTLAEVIITLVVIGVVAAITVPMMINQNGARVASERHANIVYKMANAMHLMKVHGDLDGNFENTEDFVNTLKKYIKISKICKSDEIEKCKGPNKEQLNLVDGVYKDARDIRSFNGAHFIAGDDPLAADPCSKYEAYSPKLAVGNKC